MHYSFKLKYNTYAIVKIEEEIINKNPKIQKEVKTMKSNHLDNPISFFNSIILSIGKSMS